MTNNEHKIYDNNSLLSISVVLALGRYIKYLKLYIYFDAVFSNNNIKTWSTDQTIK